MGSLLLLKTYGPIQCQCCLKTCENCWVDLKRKRKKEENIYGSRTVNWFHINRDLSIAVIYRIDCENYEKNYIEQTSSARSSRTRENKRAVFAGREISLLAQKHHDFDFSIVKIIDSCPRWIRRLFLEVWFSVRELKHIPDIYSLVLFFFSNPNASVTSYSRSVESVTKVTRTSQNPIERLPSFKQNWNIFGEYRGHFQIDVSL